MVTPDGKAPDLQGSQTCRKVQPLHRLTSVLIWRVCDDSIEDPYLAEEDGDEEGGAGGVGGRRDQEGEPGGDGEHGGGQEVDQDGLIRLMDQRHPDPCYREILPLGLPSLCSRFVALKVF